MSDLLKLAVNTRPVNTPKKPESKPETPEKDEKRKHYRRGRAALNVIPNPEQLRRLVDRALEALSKGVYWDRGSILNIVL